MNKAKQAGRHAAPKAKPPAKKKTRPVNRHSAVIIRWLIFCFPIGLLMMWSDRCHWRRWAKALVSVGFAAFITLIILPQTQPPDAVKSGVEIVSLVPATEILGPTRSALLSAADYDVYVPLHVDTYSKSVIAEPTPAPPVVYVYCNDGGKNYHLKQCRYYKKTSSRVPLTQAVDAGFTRCSKCKPPKAPDG